MHGNGDLTHVVTKLNIQDQLEDRSDMSPLTFKSKLSLIDQPLSPINVRFSPKIADNCDNSHQPNTPNTLHLGANSSDKPDSLSGNRSAGLKPQHMQQKSRL